MKIGPISGLAAAFVIGSTAFALADPAAIYETFKGRTVTFEGVGLSSGNPWKSTERFRKCRKSPIGYCYGPSPINEKGEIVTWSADEGYHWVQISKVSGGYRASHGFTQTDGRVDEDPNVKMSLK